MRNTGFVFGGIGSTMVIGGTVLVVNGLIKDMETNDRKNSNDKNDNKIQAGTILLEAGVPCLVLGIVFMSVGNNNRKEYTKRLNRLSVGFKYEQSNQGINLVYRF